MKSLEAVEKKCRLTCNVRFCEISLINYFLITFLNSRVLGRRLAQIVERACAEALQQTWV